MRRKEGRNFLTLEEKSEGIVLVDDSSIDVEWVDENVVNLNS